MPAPRALLPALILTALTLAAAPAHAALPTPTWLEPEAVTAPGTLVGGNDAVGIKMAANGGILAGWAIDVAGHPELFGRYRAPDGSWGAATAISEPGVAATRPAWLALEGGDILVAWAEDTGSGWKVRARTLSASGEWGAAEDLAGPSPSAGCPDLGQDDAGNIYLSYCTTEAVVRVRPSGSTTWGAAEPVPDSASAGDGRLAVSGDGDLTIVWTTGNIYYAASRPAGQSDWTAVATLSGAADQTAMTQVAAGKDGRVVATWVQMVSGTMSTRVAAGNARTGSWDASQQLGVDSSFLPQLISDGSGTFVTTWLSTGSTYEAFTADLTMGSGTFANTTQHNAGDDLAAPQGLTRRSDGTVYSALVHGPDLGNAIPGAMGRSPSGTWGAVQSPTDEPMMVTAGNGISADDEGNLVLSWGRADGTPMIAVGDGGGPELSSLSVPESTTVGEDISVGVTASDRFSGVVSTTWDFGQDADVIDGDSVRYTAPGTKTVRVTATDGVGNTTTETATVTVTAPPAATVDPPTVDPPKATPPKVLAPVVEARLSGRTITLNAKLTLRAGRKCVGKATATTRFGTTTYRTTLKLKLDGKTCRGAGTIKLRKTPSARTKLRITVSSSGAKSRTLTTKRS